MLIIQYLLRFHEINKVDVPRRDGAPKHEIQFNLIQFNSIQIQIQKPRAEPGSR